MSAGTEGVTYALCPTNGATSPLAAQNEMAELIRVVKDVIPFSKKWPTTCMTADSCWMIAMLGELKNSLDSAHPMQETYEAASRKQASETRVSESMIRMSSPIRILPAAQAIPSDSSIAFASASS